MDKTPWIIEWSDSLSMHNQEIDAEHRHFINLVNQLNTAIMKREDKGNLEQILELILEDARNHFKHEEVLFVEKGFPGGQEHSLIHTELLEGLEQMLVEFRGSDSNYIWVEIGLKIKELLVDHVINVDTQYIDYLRTE